MQANERLYSNGFHLFIDRRKVLIMDDKTQASWQFLDSFAAFDWLANDMEPLFTAGMRGAIFRERAMAVLGDIPAGITDADYTNVRG